MSVGPDVSTMIRQVSTCNSIIIMLYKITGITCRLHVSSSILMFNQHFIIELQYNYLTYC